jgi:hypothetical protein
VSEEPGALQRRITRTADGRVAVRLATREREILAELAAELATATKHDPETDAPRPALDEEVAAALARLSPDAVRDDADASAAFRELTSADLEASRQERFAVLATTIDQIYLDEAQAGAWLGAVNDLRLVHGTRLGVTEATGSEPVDESDPDAANLIVFLWLGWVEEQLVDALAAGLPPVIEPDDRA